MSPIAPLPTVEIARPEPSNATLARTLLEYLMSGSVEVGQRLPGERALSEALGVGRAALREAIKSLALLGILEQRQGDGTYLSRAHSDLLPRVIEWGLLLRQNDVLELVEARSYLEEILAGLAAERRTSEQLEGIRACLTRMENANDDFGAYVRADIEFHLRVAQASGNSVLAGVLENIRSLLHAWATRVINTAGETRTSLAVHKPIFEAIEEGDPSKARTAMAAHMARASRRLRESVEQGPGGSSS